jgi:hypothetical protein
MEKVIIYQIFTRLFGNRNLSRNEYGTIAENGCGKLADFTPEVLKDIKKMGVSHVWYTGVIRHATQTDYTAYGIPRQHPAIVKGRAGSPYAITDYYDVDPDLAVDVNHRMDEFEQQKIDELGLNEEIQKLRTATYDVKYIRDVGYMLIGMGYLIMDNGSESIKYFCTIHNNKWSFSGAIKARFNY